MYIRSREEVIMRIYRRDGVSKQTKPPVSSLTICDYVDKIQATDETKQMMNEAKKDMEQPFDMSDKNLEDDKDGISFMLAGYPRYRCPYVWPKTDHESLLHTDRNQRLGRDLPLKMETVETWRVFDIRPWDILVELIVTAVNPPPENPFLVDHDYFDALPIEERVVVTGAMLEFQRRIYLRHYYFSNMVLDDIKKLQHRHFRDINTLREYQQSMSFRETKS
ncbi:hypothetical protein EC988_006645 [Linderina pennispora]|nr:hypothetical protein EC988_006645 [Linderina pennispora]